jgi:putative oxidoreductase
MDKSNSILKLKSDTIQLISRLLLGGIFVYAGLTKIIQPVDFEKVVEGYKLLPGGLVHWVSIILPWVEVIVGAMLIAGLFIRLSTLILSGLLIIFIMAVGINIIRGNFTDCGCFFSSGNPISSPSDGILVILRDILFLVPGFLILYYKWKECPEQV